MHSARWPRLIVYPIAGILLAFCLLDGLLTLQGWTAHQAPTAAWIVEQLDRQPLEYAYLFVVPLVLMTLLGWIVGRKEDLLEELSVTDPLTGLVNRRRLRQELAEELNRSARYGAPLALLLIDVDRMKEINDRGGHAAGDRALQLVAEALRMSCRATDVAARHGGDEFVVLAGNTTATEALALAQRVRAAVRSLSAARSKRDPRFSVSIGAADLEGAAQPTFEALQAAADGALYQAKAEGRDRVVVAPARAASGSRRLLRGA